MEQKNTGAGAYRGGACDGLGAWRCAASPASLSFASVMLYPYRVARRLPKGGPEMPASALIRWSGLASMAGGVLFIILQVTSWAVGLEGDDLALTAAMPAWVPIRALEVVGGLLIVLGLVGLYAHQAEAAGMLGLIGFAAAFVGSVLAVANTFVFAFVPPALVRAAPSLLQADEPPSPLMEAFFASFITFGVGLVIFGIATLLGRQLPRWAAALLIVGGALNVALFFLPGGGLPFSPADLVISLAFIWLGYALWSRAGQPAAEIRRA
jgi:hypothetical protein